MILDCLLSVNIAIKILFINNILNKHHIKRLVRIIKWRTNHTNDLIKQGETYLINKLCKSYGNLCYNKTQQGGGGIKYNTNDRYRFYLIYKE